MLGPINWITSLLSVTASDHWCTKRIRILTHFIHVQLLIHMWLWGPPQTSWLRIKRSRVYSGHYQIFWVVGLEQGPLSLVSIIEELLGRKSSSSGLESREYCHRDSSCWPYGTLYLKKLTLTLPTSDLHLVGIVRSRTQATEFSF
jgi:hypothetical protein